MFLFLDENPSYNDKEGKAVTYFIASFILLANISILALAIIRMFINKESNLEKESKELSDEERIHNQENDQSHNVSRAIEDNENTPSQKFERNMKESMEKDEESKEGTTPHSSEPVTK